jgi:predicted HTH domain antitoxin
MQSSVPTDLISLTEARRLIAVSRVKMAELIRKKVIRHYPYPVDRRIKLVSKADVMALKNTRLKDNSSSSPPSTKRAA